MKPYLLLFSTFFSLVVNAATVTWTNGSGDGLWNTPGNWSGGTGVPQPTDDVIFNGTSVANCTVDAPGASFDGITITTAYTGVIDLNGQSFVSNGTNNSTLSGGTINDTPGTSNVFITTTGIYTGNGTTFGASVELNVGRMEMDGSTYNSAFIGTQTGTTTSTGSGNNTFGGTCNITNTGSGEIRMGVTNPDIFNGVTTINNNGTSYIRLAFGAAGTQFNANLIVNSNNSLGVRFGTATGTATLAAGNTFTTTGYNSGDLFMQNFTQSGATAQSFSLSGTARINMQSSTWNGDVDFDAPRVYFTGCTFNGTSDLAKTGAGGDTSPGNNTFVGNATLRNSGSAGLVMGSGNADDFQADLDLDNSGTNSITIANSGAGHTVGGNLTGTNSGSSITINLAPAASSSLDITGNVVLNNNSSAASSSIVLGNNGDVTIGGDLTYTNASSGTQANIHLAAGANSHVDITGTSVITNNGASTTTTQRAFIANSGDVTFGGDVTFTNSTTATNSEMWINHAASSTAAFNGNITIEAANGNDGIRFGESGGVGTLAATRTVAIGAGGYAGTILRFSNFTQTGATAQNLTLTGTARLFITNSAWGGNVDFESPRFYTQNTNYSGTATIEKNGASDDYSGGGNNFAQNTTLTNSGSGILGMGNGAADIFGADLTIDNTGSSQVRVSNSNSMSTVAGNLVANNSNNGTVLLFAGANSGLAVTGNATITNTTAANNTLYLPNDGSFTVGGDFTLTNTPSSVSSNVYVANTANSSLSVTGTTTINNNGTGTTTNDIYLGNNGDVTFDGILNVSQNSGTTNCRIFCNHGPTSTGTYNQNIVVESTNANGDGIYFGYNTGPGTLAAGRTITVGAGGFVSGYLYFRNFTQVGPTPQSLTLTAGSLGYNYNSDWGGNFTFIAPRMWTRGTTYNGTCYLEKTGANNDHSEGGNLYVGNATFVHTGANNFLHGNSIADVFQANLDVTNSGTGNFYLAHNVVGNTIAGNLSYTHSGSAIGGYFANTAASSLGVTGDVTITNTSSVNTGIAFANSGAATIGGNLDFSSNNSGGTSNSYLANATSSSLTISGNTTITNNGTGATTQRFWIGNNGDVTFDGTLDLINNSAATNSEIFLNHTANSVNLYNENITVQNLNATGDGIYFGNGNGAGTLAATKTITVGTGGFISGYLWFRNFTQVGPTPQSLTITAASLGYNYDSDWGGNFTFIAPRMWTRGTTYNGTSYLEKTGAGNDHSAGGNLFVGDATMVHTGANNFLHGSGNPDVFQSNLDITNNGTGNFYLAYNSAGNTVAGNVTYSHLGTALSGLLCDVTGSTLDVTGNVDITNASSANGSVAFANSGVGTIGGNLTFTSTNSSVSSNNYVANGANSSLTVDGSSTFTNSGTGATTQRFWIGNNGDITFNGTLDLINNSAAPNSEMFVNYGAASVGAFNENITVQSTVANCDGIRFGQNTGSGTLAATKTVTIGAGGFVSGDLMFRNFTQVGPTAHSLTCTGTARGYNYDSDWGGDYVFIAPRMLTRGTTYNGTCYLEKTGGISNDASVGGNLFVGNAELRNSGSLYFLMGNGVADVFQGDLLMNNTGSHNLYLGHNSAGNTIAGDFTVNNSGSANTIYVSTSNGSTVDVAGNTVTTNTGSGANSNIILGNSGNMTFTGTVNCTNAGTNGNTYTQLAVGTTSLVTLQSDLTMANNGTGTSNRVYIGSNGSVDAQGNVTITNSGTNSNSVVYVANGTPSTVTVAGELDLVNNGTATTTQAYLGSNGDMTFNGLLDIHNSSSSANSQVYCNYTANSTNTYNGNIIVESSSAGCDGVYFGSGNGTGTLAAGQTVTVGAAGFSSGQLYFRNFTQLSATAQNITVTNTGTIFYNYDSEWNGDVDFRGPRHYTRGTTYNGTAHLEKTDASSDASTGGNTFNGTTVIENSGTGYFMPANNIGNDVNADISFIQSSTGLIYPCYNSVSTYAGDVNINYTNGQIYFGAAGNGRATFDGAGAQAINDLGASTLPRFRDFHTNKSGGELTLNMPVNVTVELDLDQGVVNTSTANLMTMNDNSTVSSVSDAAHIDGPIEKIGNDAFAFPVGNTDVYQPVSMSAPSSTAARFRAQYFNTDPAPSYDDTQLDPSIHHISDCEYWTLDRTNTTNNVSVTLGFKPHTGACSGVTDPTTLVVARWDGTTWRDHGNGGTTGTPTAGDITTSGAVTNFSPFTLASTVNFPVNPLPVELLSFNGEKNGNQVDLTWVTASEINNDYFTLEKSVDGVNYEFFAAKEGAGNTSTTTNYEEVDKNPVTGWNYYKLYQTDFDGTTTYQGEVSVHFDESVDVVIFPNPSNGGSFSILTSETEQGQIEIMDAGGRLIRQVSYVGNRADIDDLNLSAGIYNVRVKFNNKQVVQKLIVR